jgi:hypothetical protein
VQSGCGELVSRVSSHRVACASVGDAFWFVVAAWVGGVPSWPEAARSDELWCAAPFCDALSCGGVPSWPEAARSDEPWCADGTWCAAPFCDALSFGGGSWSGAILGDVSTRWGAEAQRAGAALVDGVDGPFSCFASLSP